MYRIVTNGDKFRIEEAFYKLPWPLNKIWSGITWRYVGSMCTTGMSITDTSMVFEPFEFESKESAQRYIAQEIAAKEKINRPWTIVE